MGAFPAHSARPNGDNPMYSLLRPLLFKTDPEKAHHLTLAALAAAARLGLMPKVNSQTRPTRLMGLDLPNPVGLAAGLDKNAEYIDALATLGFGFIEVGTVTPRPQSGNPKPRLFRLPQQEAIVNRMGFNNHGIDAVVKNIGNSRHRGVLGINIGKNADTPIEKAAGDYLACLEKAYAHAGYITVNISSPNTQNLRDLQSGQELARLLETLKNKQSQLAAAHGRYVPLAVKIAPDLDEAQLADIARTAVQSEIDGIIATNTTTDKTALGSHPLAGEQGGLSGRPVFAKSNRVLQQLARHLDGKLPVIGAGGIMNGENAAEKMRLGAAAVQVYSGLVYRGPALVRDCLETCA